MSLYGFSQIGLPEKILYKGDTAIVISPAQLDSANASKIDNHRCQKINASLKRQIDKYEEVYVTDKAIIDNLKDQVKTAEEISVEKEKQNEVCQEQIKLEKKKLRRTKLKALAVILAEATIIILLIL